MPSPSKTGTVKAFRPSPPAQENILVAKSFWLQSDPGNPGLLDLVFEPVFPNCRPARVILDLRLVGRENMSQIKKYLSKLSDASAAGEAKYPLMQALDARYANMLNCTRNDSLCMTSFDYLDPWIASSRVRDGGDPTVDLVCHLAVFSDSAFQRGLLGSIVEASESFRQ